MCVYSSVCIKWVVIFYFRPGKVCSLCNLGERSQLGQGSFLKVKKPSSFINAEKPLEVEVPIEDSVKPKEPSSVKHRKSTYKFVISFNFILLHKFFIIEIRASCVTARKFFDHNGKMLTGKRKKSSYLLVSPW